MHTSRNDDCLFCKIADGKIPARKLHEDEYTLSFLDIYPSAKGHSLVMPKNHYATLLDIPEMELKEVIRAVQRIGAAAMKATKADGFNVVQNNREAAGQVIHHLHFHVIPRFKDDGLKMAMGSRKAEEEELKEWEKQIIGHL
ncbi:MAG: HIT family protein [Candidatus Diapherotrites archaeon]|uniref:HIT family protein n=1 Tax=Candidatus Iainarchaeum sp. TaxID=3101447 RepID=A0A8T3YKC1_9ARCH|nr:HIT family protein [Candidatus Diapherotrites archaeon]